MPKTIVPLLAIPSKMEYLSLILVTLEVLKEIGGTATVCFEGLQTNGGLQHGALY